MQVHNTQKRPVIAVVKLCYVVGGRGLTINFGIKGKEYRSTFSSGDDKKLAALNRLSFRQVSITKRLIDPLGILCLRKKKKHFFSVCTLDHLAIFCVCLSWKSEDMSAELCRTYISTPIHDQLVHWTCIRLSFGISSVSNVVPISDGTAK